MATPRTQAASPPATARADGVVHGSEMSASLHDFCSAGPVDVLLVCSSGGHLLQLLALREAWQDFSHAWVTDDTPDTRSALDGERVLFAYGPTCRNVTTMLRNARLARRVMRRLRPAVVLTTGAAIAVPFSWVARASGVSVVYVESVTRVYRPSLTARMVAPIASRLYVQWPELVPALPRALHVGSVFSDR
jgi:beta-1,4-N-acetylglucosaminyltransferase